GTACRPARLAEILQERSVNTSQNSHLIIICSMKPFFTSILQSDGSHIQDLRVLLHHPLYPTRIEILYYQYSRLEDLEFQHHQDLGDHIVVGNRQQSLSGQTRGFEYHSLCLQKLLFCLPS